MGIITLETEGHPRSNDLMQVWNFIENTTSAGANLIRPNAVVIHSDPTLVLKENERKQTIGHLDGHFLWLTAHSSDSISLYNLEGKRSKQNLMMVKSIW